MDPYFQTQHFAFKMVMILFLFVWYLIDNHIFSQTEEDPFKKLCFLLHRLYVSTTLQMQNKQE